MTLDSTRRVSDRQLHLSGPAGGQRAGSHGSSPRRAIPARSPSWASWWWRSTGWARQGRSKAFHDAYYRPAWATTRSPTRWRACRSWRSATASSTSTARASGVTRAAASPRQARCSATPTSSRWVSAESGNHDNRVYEDDWGERYQGLLVRTGGDDNYDSPRPTRPIAGQAEGQAAARSRLHGRQRAALQHPAGGRCADEGQQGFRPDHAPERTRTAMAQDRTYMMRRRWDYFVKHLLGAEPPKEYRIGG